MPHSQKTFPRQLTSKAVSFPIRLCSWTRSPSCQESQPASSGAKASIAVNRIDLRVLLRATLRFSQRVWNVHKSRTPVLTHFLIIDATVPPIVAQTAALR
jgi:hypothetical protein